MSPPLVFSMNIEGFSSYISFFVTFDDLRFRLMIPTKNKNVRPKQTNTNKAIILDCPSEFPTQFFYSNNLLNYSL